MHVKEHLLVVIYPYKFTDFIYELIELDDFKRCCEVLVLDISPIISLKFAKGISAKRSERSEVITVTSLFSFIRHIYKLRKFLNKINICVENEVSYSSFTEFICNLIIIILLRKKRINILDFYNGGIPIYYSDNVSTFGRNTKDSSFYAKVLRFISNSTLPEAWTKASRILFIFLGRFIPSATTHRLVAGNIWLKLAKERMQVNNRIKLVFGHSNDYSNNLLHNLKQPRFVLPQKKIALLLDGAGPMFGSDSILTGRKVYFTSDIWYPALRRFFDQIEEQTGVQINIAGHYKSTHPPIAPCFGNRPVHYGKTRDLVRNSEFVITQSSTAISYAIIFKKPIIFIYSNQLKKDDLAMRNIYGMAAMLGNELVNIDEPLINIEGLLKIDESRYQSYEKECLTSSSSKRPNVQIILEDIMDIDTGFQFLKYQT